MSDQRWPGDDASRQVEDRFGTPQGGFAAGSEGAGSEIWEREPAEPRWREGWEHLGGSRGAERASARRRVEQHPEVMPPHPTPVDRHAFKPEGRGAVPAVMRLLPVLGLFAAGLVLPRLFGARRRTAARASASPELVLALRSRGRRDRKSARQLAESLRGRAFRGVIAFE